MKKVKIIGAGSIGNHLAHASRRMNWDVTLCDVDPAAIERTRSSIYPSRYGKWDEKISASLVADAPTGNFDYIFIGTPPDTHLQILKQALKERPKAILVEKPFCAPFDSSIDSIYQAMKEANVPVFIGYDHVIGRAAQELVQVMNSSDLGPLRTIDVEFREHWSGIFKAHPWLSGPEDTYLGYWQRGGGATGEHSHALNFWQFLALQSKAGRVVEVNAFIDMQTEGKSTFDAISLVNLRTESGLIGRVVQDVVTVPPKKWARCQYEKGFVEWHCGAAPGLDVVIAERLPNLRSEIKVNKTRPDDFIEELTHLDNCLTHGNAEASPLFIERGLETMLVIGAIYLSAKNKSTIKIDYEKGFGLEALSQI